MKKLMLGLAVTASIAAFAVESSNVVGYNQTAMNHAGRGYGACFVNVGDAAMTLGDLKVTGYTGDSVAQVSCCKLDAYGCTSAGTTYKWYDFGTNYGWFNSESESGAGVELAPGEGLWITSPDSTFKIQSSGQVYGETLPVQLQHGGMLCPNPTPATLNLNQVIISGYGDKDSIAQVSCCKLDKYGCSLQSYQWYDFGNIFGWYTSNSEPAEETLAPGEAIWVGAPDSTFYINFPSALAK